MQVIATKNLNKLLLAQSNAPFFFAATRLAIQLLSKTGDGLPFFRRLPAEILNCALGVIGFPRNIRLQFFSFPNNIPGNRPASFLSRINLPLGLLLEVPSLLLHSLNLLRR